MPLPTATLVAELSSASANSDIGGRTFQCIPLDWYERKHTHVVRSIFVAELHALLNALGQGTLLNLTLTEIQRPGLTAGQLARIQDQGELHAPMDGFLDAKAVLDAITADPVKQPTEKNQFSYLRAA